MKLKSLFFIISFILVSNAITLYADETYDEKVEDFSITIEYKFNDPSELYQFESIIRFKGRKEYYGIQIVLHGNKPKEETGCPLPDGVCKGILCVDYHFSDGYNGTLVNITSNKIDYICNTIKSVIKDKDINNLIILIRRILIEAQQAGKIDLAI